MLCLLKKLFKQLLMLLKHLFHQPSAIVCQKYGIGYSLFLCCQWIIFEIYLSQYQLWSYMKSQWFTTLCLWLYFVFSNIYIGHSLQKARLLIKLGNCICFNCKYLFCDLCSFRLIKRGNKVIAPSKNTLVYWVYCP